MLAAAMSPMISKPSRPRPTLLLVDDTPANIDVLVGVLKADYHLKVANRGAKALQICMAGEPIDLILLDVMMPEMDGFEVCRTLRTTPATRDIPIIFLTSKTEVEDIVHGFEIGANDYLAKPFRPPELLARVRTQLTLREQQREIADKNTELAEMLQIVSHDVGNQFAVLGLVFEIVTKHGRPLEKYLPRMTAAVRNGLALTAMVRDLRRSAEKGLKLETVPLKAALDEALLLAEDRIAAKGLQVVSDVPPVDVVAETCSLTNSVFGNILSNAVKFSRRGGRITITAEVSPETVCIRFRDTGIGMSAALQEHLFDLARSRSRVGTEGERGTGFGMPLMHRFVQHYGGHASVTSRDVENHPHDHGTELAIVLRRAAPRPPRGGQAGMALR